MDGFSFDFSGDKPRINEPIPAGTKVLVRMAYTPGDVGPQGQLTASKESDAQYLKAEFTVQRGPYRGRKIFSNMTVAGGKQDEKGRSIAAGITRSTIRSILDSSGGISGKDESPEAAAKRVLPNGFADLQGRTFVTKVTVGKPQAGYEARNELGTVLTLDHKDYPKDEAELDNPVKPDPRNAVPALPAPSWSAPQVPLAVAPIVGGTPALLSGPAPVVSTAVAASVVSAKTPDALPAWAK